MFPDRAADVASAFLWWELWFVVAPLAFGRRWHRRCGLRAAVGNSRSIVPLVFAVAVVGLSTCVASAGTSVMERGTLKSRAASLSDKLFAVWVEGFKRREDARRNSRCREHAAFLSSPSLAVHGRDSLDDSWLTVSADAEDGLSTVVEGERSGGGTGGDCRPYRGMKPSYGRCTCRPLLIVIP